MRNGYLMSLGLSIFLSTLIVVGFLSFRRMGWEDWYLRKIVKRAVIWMLGSLLLIALVTWGYRYYESRPTKQTTYYGVSLGNSQEEVQYVMGQPSSVGEKDKDPIFAGTFFEWAFNSTRTGKIPANKKIFDYDEWSYDLGDNDPRIHIDIVFAPDSKRVKEIDCFSSDKTYCQPILGISTGTSEEAVVKKLGKATKESLEFGVKTMLYCDLNIKIYLEKKAIIKIAVASPADL